MTLAVVLSLLASFIWAITNHIDKFMVSGIDDAIVFSVRNILYTLRYSVKK